MLFFLFLIYSFLFRFLIESGYPNAIGIIDGKHIVLSIVPKEVEIVYVNHKGSYSINTQIVRTIVKLLKI